MATNYAKAAARHTQCPDSLTRFHLLFQEGEISGVM